MPPKDEAPDGETDPVVHNDGAGAGREESVREVAASPLSQHNPPGRNTGDREPAIPEDDDAGDESLGEGHQENSGSLGDQESEGRPRRSRVSHQTFRAACIAGNGNRPNIARAIGLSYTVVARRINADPELRRLYGDVSEDAPATPPSDGSVMNRGEGDLPEHVAVEIGSIKEDDIEIYHAALRAAGVSDKRLAKLKALNGLANDWATHLSISLRGHHQSYDGQLHNLADMADDIKERLKGKLMQDGSLQPLDAEEYTYLSKVYVECVKEGGKGVGMMLALTEALVRMMGDKSKNGGAPRATAGWGPMKKVRPEVAK